MGIRVESRDERAMRSSTEVYEIIAHYTDVTITQFSRLDDDLRLDSLDLVEIALDIECEVGIEIPDDVIEEWRTVEDVLNSTAELVRNQE